MTSTGITEVEMSSEDMETPDVPPPPPPLPPLPPSNDENRETSEKTTTSTSSEQTVSKKHRREEEDILKTSKWAKTDGNDDATSSKKGTHVYYMILPFKISFSNSYLNYICSASSN
jgi:hypothetical protein